jgi:hypothetical protein
MIKLITAILLLTTAPVAADYVFIGQTASVSGGGLTPGNGVIATSTTAIANPTGSVNFPFGIGSPGFALDVNGNLNFTGNRTLANAAFGAGNQGIARFNGSYTGTCSNGGSACGLINLSGTMALTKSGAGPGAEILNMDFGVGGAGQVGSINMLDIHMNMVSATGNAASTNYGGLRVTSNAIVTDKNGALGAEIGGMFAANFVCGLNAGALYWSECVDQENDLAIATGATANYLFGVGVVETAGNQVAPNIEAAAYTVSAQSGALPTITYGMDFSSSQGFSALASTATLFGCVPHVGHSACDTSGGASTIAYGIDLATWTFTGFAFRSTGFSVDGTGNVIGRLLTTSGFTVATLPAAGTAGRRAFVTDQNAACPAVGGTLTGGGAVKCPVFDNGTAWVSG